MKKILMTMTALSALSFAAPVAAQSWYGDRSNGRDLQMRIDAGVESGSISRREAMPLRAQLRQFSILERQYRSGGFNIRERSALRDRSRSLSRNIMIAQQNDGTRRGSKPRFSETERAGDKVDFATSDRPNNRGDRFDGDARVGQHFSARQVALPMEYRARYQDSEDSYYRYDDRRVYRIDRVTGTIMAMFDIGS